jgi:putrescine aminotransferase
MRSSLRVKKNIAAFAGAQGTAGPIVRDLCIANGIMFRTIQGSIAMCPPLVVSTGVIDQMIAIIRQSLDDAAEKLQTL